MHARISATLVALAALTCCNVRTEPRVTVAIPSGRSIATGCQGHGLGREYEGQRAILCGKNLNVTFNMFDGSDWGSLERAIHRSSDHVDILELPFEACPEDVPSATRTRISYVFSALRRRGARVVVASGNAGSLACKASDGRRFPADLPQVEVIGSGRPDFENYTLRWNGRPNYFVDAGTETVGDAGSSFAAARFVLWLTGRADATMHVELNPPSRRPTQY